MIGVAGLIGSVKMMEGKINNADVLFVIGGAYSEVIDSGTNHE
jgi:hypothetical protein